MSITVYREDGHDCAICGAPSTWRVQPGGARSVGVLNACKQHLADAVARSKEERKDACKGTPKCR